MWSRSRKCWVSTSRQSSSDTCCAAVNVLWMFRQIWRPILPFFFLAADPKKVNWIVCNNISAHQACRVQLHYATDNISIGLEACINIKCHRSESKSRDMRVRTTWRLGAGRQTAYITTYFTWLQLQRSPAVDWSNGPCNYHIPYNLWRPATQLYRAQWGTFRSEHHGAETHRQRWSSVLCSLGSFPKNCLLLGKIVATSIRACLTSWQFASTSD